MRLYYTATAILLTAASAFGQLAPLARPLTLPPGLDEVLNINPDSSYMADAVRIVDCPLDKDNPFGSCGNVLFGGMALYASSLSGSVEVRFFPPRQGIAHFELYHPGNLTGTDTIMAAPEGYTFPVRQNNVFDAFQYVTQGDLNLSNGEVTNFVLGLNMFNTFYQAFGNSNPRAKLEYFQFPGPYGSAWVSFSQRADGLLDLTLHATTFLPLGNTIDGDLPRIPMPFCGQGKFCASIQAPGSSFRPSINYTTVPTPAAAKVTCGDSCADIPANTVQQYFNSTYGTYFREGFTMNIPQLGGSATGRTHFDGRTIVQFGPRTGDLVPVWFELLTPAGSVGKPPKIDTTLPLIDGITPGFIGKDIALRFPTLTYFPLQMSYSSDPFDGTRGLLNVKTGRFVDDLLFSGYLIHNVLLRVIEQNLGRIPLSPFLTRGPATFTKGPRGETVFRLFADGYRNYTGFLFPAQDLISAHGWFAGPGSRLDPHISIEAVQPAPGDDPASTLVKTGNYSVTTPTGDPVTLSYLVSCSGQGPSSLTYTNKGPAVRAGSFTMESLLFVKCTNSPNSKAAPGDFDQITFSGTGLWSADPDKLDPHLVSVHVFPNAPQGLYFSVLIDGGDISNADLKPPTEPVVQP